MSLPTGTTEVLPQEEISMTRLWRTYCSVAAALAAVLLAGCAGQQAGPSRTADEAAQDLAKLSVELGSLDGALDRAAELGWSSSAATVTLELGRNPTEEEESQVRGILRTVLAEFLTAEVWETTIADVYAQNFTADELQQALDFYNSPVGRKVLELDDELTLQVDDRIGEALDPKLEEFVGRIDQELVQQFPELAGEDGS
jgi:hypothetical protein